MEETPIRRSTRSNLGAPPQRFTFDEADFDDDLTVGSSVDDSYTETNYSSGDPDYLSSLSCDSSTNTSLTWESEETSEESRVTEKIVSLDALVSEEHSHIKEVNRSAAPRRA